MEDVENVFRAAREDTLTVESIDSLRKEIEDLENINLMVKEFEKTSLLHQKKFLKNRNIGDKALKIKLLNSKIKERQEINEKLKILLYHLSLLKSTLLTKDHNTARRCVQQFTTNDFTKISAVINDVDKFKKDIDELNRHYSYLLDSGSRSLDIKITGEFGYQDFITSLYGISRKQEMIVGAMGKNFVSTAKELINNDWYKNVNQEY